jgi:peptide/nickel transport system permease protein
MIAARVVRMIGRRLLSSLPALFGVVTLTFLLMRVLPGDPAVFFASGPNTGQAEIDIIRERMGLNRPMGEQFVLYLRDLAKGDLGNSLTSGQPVAKDLMARLPASLELTLAALALALCVALPLGFLAAMRPDSPTDQVVRVFCTLGVAVPTFVSGLLLVFVFYYLLGWAPPPVGRIDAFAAAPPTWSGFLLVDNLLAGDMEAFGAALRQLVLPMTTMALFVMAPLARMTRAATLAVTSSDFVRAAEALGLPRARIMVSYILRNAMLPILTTVGIVFSTMLGANVLVEKVFAWPGIASYALDALLSSDYAPVQGFVLMIASIFVVLNLVIDLLYSLADPRVSVE